MDGRRILSQELLKGLKEGDVALFQADAGFYGGSVRIVDDDLKLHVFPDPPVQHVAHEGENVGMVVAEGMPRAPQFSQSLKVQFHSSPPQFATV